MIGMPPILSSAVHQRGSRDFSIDISTAGGVMLPSVFTVIRPRQCDDASENLWI
jgi:hypothetical protein